MASPFPLVPPPATFFTINGLSSQLQQAPYAQYIPALQSTLIALSSNINILDYIDTPTGTMFSSYQLQTYDQQLGQYRYIYSYNQNAYNRAIANSTYPRYFKFVTFKDQSNYRTSIGLVDRLYEPYIMNIMFNIPWPPFSS